MLENGDFELSSMLVQGGDEQGLGTGWLGGAGLGYQGPGKLL